MTSTPTPDNGSGKSPVAVLAAAVGAMIGTIRHARSQPRRVDDIPGVNDFRRRSVRRRPVVLVHGTWCSAYDTWHTMAPALVKRGYPVFALDYGHRRGYDTTNVFNMVGGADIAESARELAGFVERVVAVTGSDTVDLVGHSQGGTVAHQYLKFNGGSNANDPSRNRVRSLVTLGATNHGTTYGNKQIVGAVAEKLGFPVVGTTDATVGPSYAQQLFGSPFIAALNEHGDTVPGVRYTVLATRFDTVSTPPKATFLDAGEGAVVTNLWLQDVAPDSTAGHMELTTDRAAVEVVLNALDDAGDRRQLR
ncbi:esterase/lipase family protein [Rhodococcoides corynebacterioides]|uniref:Alpha/beta fold hydrolase n=1 Tax=Rhodococcoides corynebacterioides TaxID=53972 RepID=A0ABS7P8Y2_9NOCA|nr:alpha/beta fold hydrolase [Rhodococcus corynebacterioides]MBY6368501.1 alpha/beta fold hydrolase [Rhodococcus corynebacterioides]MBY6409358.1 alpha/beta fold hydrolase [Rhodococcus corynebacterioides]